MLTRLDIINSMLASKGTAPIATGYENHPNYVEANAVLSLISNEVQGRGFWFNSGTRTLQCDVDGRVVVPDTYLHADPLDTTLGYAIRGRYLYNAKDGTDVIGTSVAVSAIEELAVEDLPSKAAAAIRAMSVYAYFLDKKGEEPKLSEYRNLALLAESRLKGEDLKNRDLNFFNGASARAMARVGYAGRRLPI